MALFANPPADPSVFWYRTTDPYASDYGWTVGIIRTRPELAELIVLPGGFALTGSGVAEVVTRGGHPRAAVCTRDRSCRRWRADDPAGGDRRQRPAPRRRPLGPSAAGDIIGRHTAQVRSRHRLPLPTRRRRARLHGCLRTVSVLGRVRWPGAGSAVGRLAGDRSAGPRSAPK